MRGAAAKRAAVLGGLLLLLLAAPAWAGGGGGVGAIVIVADSRRFTGWNAWWSNLYNESCLYCALLTVVIMPAMGACLAWLTDALLRRLGLNLRSRVLAEH